MPSTRLNFLETRMRLFGLLRAASLVLVVLALGSLTALRGHAAGTDAEIGLLEASYGLSLGDICAPGDAGAAPHCPLCVLVALGAPLPKAPPLDAPALEFGQVSPDILQTCPVSSRFRAHGIRAPPGAV
ncbi:MAG: hypothetical protein AAF871_00835 [Pseudomonadota bacterium]